MKRHLYPHNWNEISFYIREKAGNTCEHCGSESKPGRILTVHHLDGNPNNNAFSNLVALCQVCHLHIQARYEVGQEFLFERPSWAETRGL